MIKNRTSIPQKILVLERKNPSLFRLSWTWVLQSTFTEKCERIVFW